MSNPPPPALKPAAPAQPTGADILGLRVDLFDRLESLRRAGALMSGAAPALLVTANTLMAMEAENNPALREVCRSAELVIVDSVGLVWAAGRLGQPRPPRLPGIDFAFALCREAVRRNLSIYLLGAATGVAEAAAAFLKSTHPGLRVAGTRDGFFNEADENAVVGEIEKSGARLILVALGMPKQELWIHRLRSMLPPGLYVGVGGSFDVWSGRLARAPKAFQKLGLEWFYRLLQEPTRYHRMIQLPLFAWRVLRRPRA